MKLEELPSGSYRAKKVYKGKTYRVTFDHVPDDKEILMALSEQMEQDNTGVKGTFEKCANDYIQNRSNVTSPATVRTYNTKLNQLTSAFKSLKIHEITNADVQSEINTFSEKHAPKTTKTLYGFISSVLAEYRPNLHLRVKLPQIIKKNEYDPSSEDIQRILEDVKGSKYSIPFQLGVLSCRRGEICALNINDLDGNNLFIHRSMVYDENNNWIIKETPKTDSSNRLLPLPEKLANEIREQGYIYDGHPNALNKAIHRAQKRLGIPEFKFHKLRSYFASYADSIGIPESAILAIGGWNTPSIMKSVYRKALETSKQEAIKKISDSLLG